MAQPGSILWGKYRIERMLGKGGIGMVAQAHHLDLDVPVAIKFLLPEMLAHNDVVQRFTREAQAAVKLKSEHVCQVLDVGRLEDGTPCIVMEYMKGTDLHDLLEQQGRLVPGYAVDLVLQACLALAEAHSHGIVHRDIKPSNLFVTRRPDGEPLLKVLDFGISKASAEISNDMTSTQTMLGTPSYMSPEQMRTSKHVDARSDLWSLGVVLYELVNGYKPFRSRVFTELCLEVIMDPPQPIGVPLPPGLAEAILRCLAKDRDTRFQNVAEFAASLVPFASAPPVAHRMAERCARILGLAGPLRAGTRPGLDTPALGTTTLTGAPPSTMNVSIGQMIVDSGTMPGETTGATILAKRRGLVAGGAGLTLAAVLVTAAVLSGGDAGRGNSVGASGGAGFVGEMVDSSAATGANSEASASTPAMAVSHASGDAGSEIAAPPDPVTTEVEADSTAGEKQAGVTPTKKRSRSGKTKNPAKEEAVESSRKDPEEAESSKKNREETESPSKGSKKPDPLRKEDWD